jgi:hypothetical protein
MALGLSSSDGAKPVLSLEVQNSTDIAPQDEALARQEFARRMEGMFFTWREQVLEMMKYYIKEQPAKFKRFKEVFTMDRFRRQILPVLMGMYQEADWSEGIERTNFDGMSVLGHLCTEGIFNEKVDLDPALIREFFSPEEPPAKATGNRVARGQYRHFFTRFGYHATCIVAQFQGAVGRGNLKPTEEWHDFWEKVESYVGKDNLDKIASVWQNFPTEIRTGKVFNRFLAVCKRLNDKDERLMSAFLTINGRRNFGAEKLEDLEKRFPYFDGDEVEKEMEALAQYPDLVEELAELGRWTLYRFKANLTYQKERTPVPEGGLERVRLTTIPDNLERAGYSPEEIKEILKLPMSVGNHRLETYMVDILSAYPQIDQNYPGGVKAFIEFWEDMLDHDSRHEKTLKKLFMARRFVTPKGYRQMPKKNREDYTRVATDVMKYLREFSFPYWEYTKWGQGMKDLLREDPEAFEAEMQKACQCAFQFFVFAKQSWRPAPEPAKVILEAYLKNYGEPGFEGFIDGLSVLADHWARRLEDRCWHGDTYMMQQDVCAYVGAPDYVEHLTGKRPSLEKFDGAYAAHALSLKDDIRSFPTNEDANFNRTTQDLFADLVEGYQGGSLLDPNFECPELGKKECEQVFLGIQEQLTEIRRIGSISAAETLKTLEKPLNRIHRRIGRVRRKYARGGDEEMVEELKRWEKLSGNLKRQMRSALRLSDWQGILGLQRSGSTIVGRNTEIPQDHWLRQANMGTQFAAVSGSLYASLGLEDSTPGLRLLNGMVPEGVMEPLDLSAEKAALSEGTITIEEMIESIRQSGREGVLRRNIAQALPFVAQRIQTERLKLPGLMAMGSKIETQRAMSASQVRFVLDLGGFGDIRTTPFRLKHANKSLVQPPMPTAFEEQLNILMFCIFGVVDKRKPDFQVTAGARWGEEMASTVGSSMILGSQTGVRYRKGAFGTEHWDDFTGARIMVYDAGVRSKRLPFDIPGARGRTDMMGRRDLDDLNLWQILQTMATHGELEGRFGAHMQKYRERLMKVLKKFGRLDRAMNESAWIYQNNEHGDIQLYHESMVWKFSDAWFEFPELRQAVRILIGATLVQPMLEQRDTILREERDEVEYLKNY